MDFALILFVLSVVTGILWCLDVFFARKRRGKRRQDALEGAIKAKREGQLGAAELILTRAGMRQSEARAVLETLGDEAATDKPAKDQPTPRLPDPWWVEYGASFFVVILPIFLLRSFWLEPFRIPSGSMIPTLLVGDFILVNKYAYGVRLPVLNKKVIEVGEPKRGDVMVFRYPIDPTQNFIKRVVGLPGDKVAYINKRLTINGEVMPVRPDQPYEAPGKYMMDQFTETLGGVEHRILNESSAPPFTPEMIRLPHAYQENCKYSEQGVECVVPAGYYFMMGDNRDQSSDSRVWGFVPDENIVGKAFFVWFHAEGIIPPSGIEFGRIGNFH